MKLFCYYLKIYKSFIKNTLVREMDYRGNLIAEIMDSILNFGVNITFFEVLYLNVTDIAGWSKIEILILVGVTQLITSLLYILFMNNLPRIQRYIFNGELDYIVLKPCDEQFYVSCRYFYFGGIPNLIFSVLLIYYGMSNLDLEVPVISCIVFMLYIISGIIICYSMWLIIMTFSIFFLKIGQLHELFLSILKFMEYPKGIYSGLVSVILLYVIPLVTVTNVPVEILLGKIDYIHSTYILGLAILFILLSRFLWKVSLKWYSSASS